MKKIIFTKFTICVFALFAAACMALSSCTKLDGHVISTATVVKSATMTFTYNATTYTLATTTDTVGFNTTTVPVTTITAKNGLKTTSCVFSFNSNIAGSFPIAAITLTVPYNNGSATSSATNSGSVTVSSFSQYGGQISGTFTSTLPLPGSSTMGTITGTFSIQQ